MTRTIEPVKGFENYCGPAALSAITGFTREESARRLTEMEYRLFRSRPRAGTYTVVLKNVLEGVGYDVTTERFSDMGWDVSKRLWVRVPVPTLKQFLETFTTGTYLITTAHHFVVVHNGAIVEDNGFRPLRARVKTYTLITPRPGQRIASVTPKPAPVKLRRTPAERRDAVVFQLLSDDSYTRDELAALMKIKPSLVYGSLWRLGKAGKIQRRGTKWMAV